MEQLRVVESAPRRGASAARRRALEVNLGPWKQTTKSLGEAGHFLPRWKDPCEHPEEDARRQL